MNEYQLRKVLESGGQLDPYTNTDASGGINQRYNGRALAENEFVLLQNADISVPGKRTKRLGPANPGSPRIEPATGSYATVGMICFTVNFTESIIIAAAYSQGGTTGLYRTYDCINFILLPGATPNVTGYCNMQVAANYVGSPFTSASIIYIIDAVGSLYATDGNTVAAITLLDVGNNPITGLQDMTWFMNQMFYVGGSFCWFSNINEPTTIQNAAVNVALGDGSNLRRVFAYRDGQLILFKYGTSGTQGSIHLLDVSSGTPSQYQLNTQPLFDGLNMCSPRCVTRMGFDVNAEVVFATLEGLRTDAFTALDRLITPSLPFTQNVPDLVSSITPYALDAAFTMFWNDELLWFVPINDSLTPNYVVAYQTKVPKQDELQGITFMDGEETTPGPLTNMAATCATIGSINGNPPALLFAAVVQVFYGPIRQAFYQDNGETYTEISRRVDHGIPLNEKEGLKLGVMLDTDHVGAIDVQINFDDGTYQTVGTYAPTGGVNLPCNLPVSFDGNQEFTALFDLHFDSPANPTAINPAMNGNLKRYMDAEVQISSTSLPSILGWYLQSAAIPVRWQSLNSPIPNLNDDATPVEPQTVPAGVVAWE